MQNLPSPDQHALTGGPAHLLIDRKQFECFLSLHQRCFSDEIFLFLRMRFETIFPETASITLMQEEVCKLVEYGIEQFVTLIQNSDPSNQKPPGE